MRLVVMPQLYQWNKLIAVHQKPSVYPVLLAANVKVTGCKLSSMTVTLGTYTYLIPSVLTRI